MVSVEEDEERFCIFNTLKYYYYVEVTEITHILWTILIIASKTFMFHLGLQMSTVTQICHKLL